MSPQTTSATSTTSANVTPVAPPVNIFQNNLENLLSQNREPIFSSAIAANDSSVEITQRIGSLSLFDEESEIPVAVAVPTNFGRTQHLPFMNATTTPQLLMTDRWTCRGCIYVNNQGTFCCMCGLRK